jgi:hypothetical protein
MAWTSGVAATLQVMHRSRRWQRMVSARESIYSERAVRGAMSAESGLPDPSEEGP